MIAGAVFRKTTYRWLLSRKLGVEGALAELAEQASNQSDSVMPAGAEPPRANRSSMIGAFLASIEKSDSFQPFSRTLSSELGVDLQRGSSRNSRVMPKPMMGISYTTTKVCSPRQSGRTRSQRPSGRGGSTGRKRPAEGSDEAKNTEKQLVKQRRLRGRGPSLSRLLFVNGEVDIKATLERERLSFLDKGSKLKEVVLGSCLIAVALLRPLLVTAVSREANGIPLCPETE
mmetsp:Transcript_38620/g.120947  ORF Transcript_38620/g.120947 Transcript_38620/m.120947 type:complete len:230 (-) Transcript_38620:99-788(-)